MAGATRRTAQGRSATAGRLIPGSPPSALQADGPPRRRPHGLGRSADRPGQLHLEAAGHEVARHAPGRQLPGLPRSTGDDHVLDRARRHVGRGGDDHVRARLAPAAPGGREPRRVPRARRLARSRAPRRPRGAGPRARADRRPGGRRRLPPSQHLPRLGAEHRVGSPPGGHLASRPRGRRVPPGERRPRLLPLPPGGRHDDGRVLFPLVWTSDGRRSAWLDAELPQDLGRVLAESGNRP